MGKLVELDAIVVGGGHNGLVAAAYSPGQDWQRRTVKLRARGGAAATPSDTIPTRWW